MILRNVLSQFFIVKCFSKSLLVNIYFILENSYLNSESLPKKKQNNFGIKEHFSIESESLSLIKKTCKTREKARVIRPLVKEKKMTRIHGDLECHKIDKAVREY